MNVGTKSILFGVHAFWWHPFTVAMAWRKLYGKWPDRYQWVAIFCHDLGYWGCPNMDGAEGRKHPERGATIVWKLVLKFDKWRGNDWIGSIGNALDAYHLCLGHSREYAKLQNVEPSKLCWADKFCCFYDPTWFYLLRAHLSGEIYEFRANAIGHIPETFSYTDWYRWYRLKILWLPEIQNILAWRRASRSRSCVFPF